MGTSKAPGDATPPAFITIAKQIIIFESPDCAEIGIRDLETKVWDSIDSQVSLFNLTVKNEPRESIQTAQANVIALTGGMTPLKTKMSYSKAI